VDNGNKFSVTIFILALTFKLPLPTPRFEDVLRHFSLTVVTDSESQER